LRALARPVFSVLTTGFFSFARQRKVLFAAGNLRRTMKSRTVSALLVKAKEDSVPPVVFSIAPGKLLAWEWRKILVREAAHVIDTYSAYGAGLMSDLRFAVVNSAAQVGRRKEKKGDKKWTLPLPFKRAGVQTARTYSWVYLIYQRSIDGSSTHLRTTPTMCVAVSMSDISKGLD